MGVPHVDPLSRRLRELQEELLEFARQDRERATEDASIAASLQVSHLGLLSLPEWAISRLCVYRRIVDIAVISCPCLQEQALPRSEAEALQIEEDALVAEELAMEMAREQLAAAARRPQASQDHVDSDTGDAQNEDAEDAESTEDAEGAEDAEDAEDPEDPDYASSHDSDIVETPPRGGGQGST